MILQPSEWYAKQDRTKHYVRPIDGAFENRISAGQKKRIRKCEALGLWVRMTIEERAYPVVAENRARKGRKYGMELEDWQALRRQGLSFPFIIEGHAAALCVQVAPKVLYVSGWGDVAGVEHLSPVCLLAKGIYGWCIEFGFEVLDVGIADDPGLIQFKERLGFVRAE